MRNGILILDGDPRAREELAAALGAAGWRCAQADSIPEAVAQLSKQRCDLVLLDAGLCGADASELTPLLQMQGRPPVIAISSRGKEEDIPALLNAGVEDYMMRPFEIPTLVERMEVQLRRVADAAQSAPLCHRDLTLDPVSLRVSLCGCPVNLTRQEFKILELMLSFPPGRVFSKRDFFNYAWSGSYVGADKTVNVHICNMRRKFKAITSDEYIETIWGFGFRLA